WQDYRQENYEYNQYSRLDEFTVTDLTPYTEPYITAGRTRTWGYNYEYYPDGIKIKSLSIDGPRLPADIEGNMDDITTMYFNSRGLLSSSVNALGHTVTYSDFDALGRAGLITDANGV